MRALLPALVLLAAGCVQAPIETAAVDDALAAGAHARWAGEDLVGEPVRFEDNVDQIACWSGAACPMTPIACGEQNCDRRSFDVPAGAGAVTVTLRWPTDPTPKFDLWLENADGAIVAAATHEFPFAIGLAARLDDPAPGTYTAVVAARTGSIPYEAAWRIEPPVPDAPTRPLLPNLVTLPPTDLTLETPAYVGVSYFAWPLPGVREAATAAGVTGCRLDERAEQGDARCLRFSNAVANLGDGPLDVRLAAGSTRFVQHVHQSDGSTKEHAAGPAEWHAAHAHWHNAASNRFTLHAYDPTSGAMGAPLGEGKKGGICFADVGLVDVGLPGTRSGHESGWNCFQPKEDDQGSWRMGITPGWYDLYTYPLSDQYVDITGVEDGTYALCSVTNEDGAILETDLADNLACTRFRLAGDDIELLDEPPYHTTPADARMR